MNVVRYAVEDANGDPLLDAMWDADEIGEAREFARDHGGRLIEYTFEFSDSELVEDYSEVAS